MPEDGQDTATEVGTSERTARRRGSRRPTTNPGGFGQFLNELRSPGNRELTADEMAWMAEDEEQARLRQEADRSGPFALDDDHMARLRKRYGGAG